MFSQKKLTRIEDLHNKHTVGDLSCSWATLKKCLGAIFQLGFDKPFEFEKLICLF